VSHGMIIPLIIHTIRRDPSRSDGIDEPCHVSRSDPSGAVQIDAEHQATDLAVGGSNPSRRASKPQVSGLGLLARSWRAFGPRRLRRQSEPCLVATQGDRVRVPLCFDHVVPRSAGAPRPRRCSGCLIRSFHQLPADPYRSVPSGRPPHEEGCRLAQGRPRRCPAARKDPPVPD
jgi:hypothetical protein